MQSELEYHNLLITNYMRLNLPLQNGKELEKKFDSIIYLLDQEID